MEEVATIAFEECESASEAVAIVRRDVDHVALSINSDGDLEVFMRKEDAGKLVDALQKALS